MRRRDVLIGAVAATPFLAFGSAHAQTTRPRRVGVFIGSGRDSDPEVKLHAQVLESSLQKLGWINGRNIAFDYRFSGGDPAVMDTHIVELLALSPDVIVVQGNRPTALIKRATSTIPVVFAMVGDPVGSGLIDNLARPGGNVTGFTHFEPSMGGKWLETLRDVAPAVRRVTIIMHATTPANIAFLRVAEAAAPALGLTIAPAGVQGSADIEKAIAAAAGADAGLVVFPHDVTVANNSLISTAAARAKLPGVYPFRYFVTQGGLVSYSFDTVEHWRQVTGYVDRILRGEKPANLPVQAPTKFELVVNLKTASALGLTVPPTLLGRADEVIE
jgi:putative ABC transport system substrate-binding protein